MATDPSVNDDSLLASTADGQLQLAMTPIQGGYSYDFRWVHHAKVAVFKLRTSVWIVFDRHEQLSFNPNAKTHGRQQPLTQVENQLATVLEIADPHYRTVNVDRTVKDETDANGNTVYEKDENGQDIPVPIVDWIVDIKQPTVHDPTPSKDGDMGPDSIDGFFKTKRPGNPVTLTDPDSGEVLIAVPIYTDHKFIAETIDFKTYSALPSVQGLLLKPQGDIAHFMVMADGLRVVNAKPVLERQ